MRKHAVFGDGVLAAGGTVQGVPPCFWWVVPPPQEGSMELALATWGRSEGQALLPLTIL